MLLFCHGIMMNQNQSYSQVKHFYHYDQFWMGYFNQTRFSNKWGSWAELHLRTRNDFFDQFSQSIVRFGLMYYISDGTRLTIGHAFVYNYPLEGFQKITVPEHREWQQIQWHGNFKKSKVMQWLRLEERYRRKLIKDSALGNGYNFSYRLRYNVRCDYPLKKNNGNINGMMSLLINNEFMVNFGKQVIYNYFDQNRFFVGLKYQVSASTNLQAGYMNLFQQLASGSGYRVVNAARIYLQQNFDLRKKSKHGA